MTAAMAQRPTERSRIAPPELPAGHFESEETCRRLCKYIALSLRAAGVASIYTPKDYELTRIVADMLDLVERETALSAGATK